VHQQNGLGPGGTFIDVLDPQSSAIAIRDLEIVRVERVAGKVSETPVWSPQ